MVKNEFFIIGCGKFGAQVADSLSENGLKIILLDKDPAKVNRLQKSFDYAMATDATDLELLRETSVSKARCIIVGISDIQDSILTCANLIELGAQGNIIARATNIVHKRVLRTMGIEHVTVPEVEVAKRVALQAMYKFDESLHSLTDAHSWTKLIVTNRQIIHKQIKDLKIKEELESLVLSVKKNNINEFPVAANTKLDIGDEVIIVCPNKNIGKVITFFTDRSQIRSKKTKKRKHSK